MANNYSEHGIIKKQHEIKSTSSRLMSKARVTAFRFSLVFALAVVVIGAFAGFGALRGLTDNAPSTANINLQPTSYKTTIYYSDGSIADTLYGAEANRDYVYISEIPKIVQYAFIAKEDTRFYEHNGIDVHGIMRAIVSNLRTMSFDYGGSTITQQLLKNQVFGGGDEGNLLEKITRKVQEQFLAIRIENQYSKDEILEFYLNTLNLGNGCYGIQTAAQGYFGKDVWDLTLSEAAVLAPIAYSPTYRNPITNPESNAEQRLELLNDMLELGYCNQEEYDEALADDVYTRIQNHKAAEDTSPFSYFTDELIEQILSDFQLHLGYTEKEASDLLYKGGLKIYTTQDKEIQQTVDSIYTDESYFPAFGDGSYYELTYALSVYKADGSIIHYQQKDLMNYFASFHDIYQLYYREDDTTDPSTWIGISELCKDYDDINAKCDEFKEAMLEEGDTPVEKRILTPQPQSSIVLIEQSTGKVVALYGGRGEKTASRVINRATNTVRQVGSTFKVLASFLPALDSAGMTLATVIDDTQYFYPGTDKEVINWYSTGWRGLNSIRTGIYNSMNVVAVKTLELVGPSVAFNYLKKLGFSTLVTSQTVGNQEYTDIGLPLALGGLTNGVTNLEMTAAYASIANNGIYQEPIMYTVILDHDGKLLLSNESAATQVMKSSTAWLLTDAMEDTITLGTGSRLAFKEYSMPVAGKTGTASKNNDLWFVGYTPYYTAAIWTGYDNNFSQTSTKYHQHIWREIMEQTHTKKQLPYKEFEMPDSVVTASICTKCGKLAIEGLCDAYIGGNCIKTEYFAKGSVPKSKCDCHVKISVCKDSKHIACSECPLDSIEEKVYLVKTEAVYRDLEAEKEEERKKQEAKKNGTEYIAPVKNPEDVELVVTNDTPFILPTGEEATPCPIHSVVTEEAEPGESVLPVLTPDNTTIFDPIA